MLRMTRNRRNRLRQPRNFTEKVPRSQNVPEEIKHMVFLDSLLGMFSIDMGIDLGTCNTLVCV